MGTVLIYSVVSLSAIFLFLWFGKETLRKYDKKLQEVKDIIGGVRKNNYLRFFYFVEGQFKGRKVICGLQEYAETRKPTPVLRVKLNIKVPQKKFHVFSLPRPSLKTTLSGDWLYWNSSVLLRKEGFREILGEMSITADELEAGKIRVD